MSKRTKPIRTFDFAENTPYSRTLKRRCKIQFDDNKGITFRFNRWGQNVVVAMHRDDVDEFLNWYQIENAFLRRQEKYD